MVPKLLKTAPERNMNKLFLGRLQILSHTFHFIFNDHKVSHPVQQQILLCRNSNRNWQNPVRSKSYIQNSLLCDKDLMTTGNHVKSCDKRARLHPPETNSMTESAPGKWQIVQAKRNKPSGEVKKKTQQGLIWGLKHKIRNSSTRISSDVCGEEKIILFLSNNSKSLLLCAGYRTQKEGFLWAEQKFVTGRERKAKRASSHFSGDRSTKGKGLLQLFPAHTQTHKKTIWLINELPLTALLWF